MFQNQTLNLVLCRTLIFPIPQCEVFPLTFTCFAQARNQFQLICIRQTVLSGELKNQDKVQ